MSNTILIKRSSTPNAVPTANSISQGELAINLVDGNLFYKNSTDQVTVIASNKFVTVSGNVDGGNIVTSGQVSATGNITGNYILGNGALLTGIDAASIQNGNSNVRVSGPGGNVVIGINGTANVAVFSTSGLVVSGNVDATAFNGSGAGLTSIPGANVTGQVGNALVAGTVYTAAQPNITSVGTLSSLSVTGTVTGGNVETAGTVSAGGNITAGNIGAVRGSFTNVDGTLSTAAQPNITSVGTLSSLSVTGTVTGGNVATAGTVSATGNITGGNIDAVRGSFTTVSGTLETAAQPNITSVGTLTSVSVTGNVDAGNISGNGAALSSITGANVTGQVGNALVAGTVYTAAQPNITSVGTLSSLSVTGTVTGGNVATAGTVSAGGNITGNYIIGNGSQLTDVTATNVGTLSSLSVTGNVVGGNLTTSGVLVVTGTGVSSISGNLNMNSQNITSVANPVLAQDAATKSYVDTLVATGIHFHAPVRVESPINLVATYNNGAAGVGATLTNSGTQAALVIDGVTVSAADRVLIYEQTDQTQNGIYVVTDVGSGSTNWILTRASDADTYVINSADGLSEGSSVFVQQGATGAGELYTCNTAGVITFGTTNITFVQINSAQIYSAGTGLALEGTQFSIANTAVTAGSYGTGDQVATFTVNNQGQITAAANTSITANAANLTGTTLNSSIVTSSLTSVGTLGSLSVTGNVTSGNISTGGTASAAGTITGGNLATGGTVSATGNVTGGNIVTVGLVAAGTLSGNGAAISSITGANVTGQVGNALVAGTVYTAAQPNITSVGTLSSLSVTGTVTGGNIATAGTANIATLEITTLANIKATTAASSTTTGALIVAGGVGVAGNVYAGEVYAAGNEVLTVISTVDGGTY